MDTSYNTSIVRLSLFKEWLWSTVNKISFLWELYEKKKTWMIVFLIKITSIRKLQLIWLTFVKLIISDNFVAKDHVWKGQYCVHLILCP